MQRERLTQSRDAVNPDAENTMRLARGFEAAAAYSHC
jgi:hypothetical protein